MHLFRSADIDKWIFDDSDTPYDYYSCTTSKSGRRRSLTEVDDDRRRILEKHNVDASPGEYADQLFDLVTSAICPSCADSVHRRRVADRMLDAKIRFAKNRGM